MDQELSSNRLKIESQVSELRGLTYSNDSLTAEVESLRQKDEYRRDLMTDLSTELSLTVSRENQLQVEVDQLKERSITDGVTTQSMGSREQSFSVDVEDLHKELEEAAVREAMLQCEIAEANGERDALELREQARAQETLRNCSRLFDEDGTVLSMDDPLDISSLPSPSDEAQADTSALVAAKKDEADAGTAQTADAEENADDGKTESAKKDTSAQCPIQ